MDSINEFRRQLPRHRKRYQDAIGAGDYDLAAYVIALVALASADTRDSHKNVRFVITPVKE